jgi:hypothetical protein
MLICTANTLNQYKIIPGTIVGSSRHGFQQLVLLCKDTKSLFADQLDFWDSPWNFNRGTENDPEGLLQ